MEHKRRMESSLLNPDISSLPRYRLHRKQKRGKLHAGPSTAVKTPGEGVYFATFPLVGLESLETPLVFSGRELPRFMAQHCAIIVGQLSEGAVQVVEDFNSSWDKQLKLYQNDCRTYSQELARRLLADREWQIGPSLMQPLTGYLQS